MEIDGKNQLRFLHFAYRMGRKLGLDNIRLNRLMVRGRVKTVEQLTEEFVQKIESGTPMLVARLGATEGTITGQYCEKKVQLRQDYSEEMLQWLFTTSGFFALDSQDKTQLVDRYAQMTLEGMAECDYLSAFFPTRVYMPYFFSRFAKKATPTYSYFGPFFDQKTEDTWLRALKGKKVLVVNSFAESIQSQYKRKAQLVQSAEYELPDFELIVYKTKVTQVGERPDQTTDFFGLLNEMVEDIKKIDFDVALVGAGAYGFPISVEIKRMGKIAIEPCGKTPLFFGVYGERDLKDGVEEYRTDAWIRPMEQPPKRFKEIENGCYW